MTTLTAVVLIAVLFGNRGKSLVCACLFLFLFLGVCVSVKLAGSTSEETQEGVEGTGEWEE